MASVSRGTEGLQTRSWRETDSNPRSLLGNPPVLCADLACRAIASVPNVAVTAPAPPVEPPYMHVGAQSTATSNNVGSAVVSKALRSASSSASRRSTEIALTPWPRANAAEIDIGKTGADRALQPEVAAEFQKRLIALD
jgi:hypothetical protein